MMYKYMLYNIWLKIKIAKCLESEQKALSNAKHIILLLFSLPILLS